MKPRAAKICLLIVLLYVALSSLAIAQAQIQRVPGPDPEGYYGTVVLQLNPPSDSFGPCDQPFSSGTGFRGTPQWVHHTVDLSAFANKMVAIRFFFDTRDPLFNKFEGWYLDNIKIGPRISSPGAAPDFFTDDVENGNMGWVPGGNRGTAPGWHITTRRALSGSHSWWFGNEATGTFQPFAADCSDARSFGSLLSPIMKLGNNPTLEFDTLWEIESVNPSSFDIMQVQVEVDSDEDGLLDDWEIHGIDGDGDGTIDLILPGANPFHKDIFVEADFMEALTHSHRPDPNAVNDVVQAFANAPISNPDGSSGITFHLLVDESLPEQFALDFNTGFDPIKAAHFGTVAERSDPKAAAILAAKRLAYHYVIFGHQQVGTTSSGIAELPGNDFFISLGAFDNQVGTRKQQAGTLMHELGHNLNLRHGGGDNINRKPNYLSIMNYSFQMNGITNLFSGNRLDYSENALPALDENSLSELFGLGDGFDSTLYFCPGATSQTAALAFGPIDWNCNGLISLFGSVSADVNGDGSRSSLTGFNDWAHLKLNFQDTTDFADGVHLTTTPQVQPEQELDAETAAKIPEILAVNIDVKPASTTNPINPKSRGVTPVAILSSNAFDATTVVPASVRFAGSAALRSSAIEDVNGDGLPDLVLHFDTQSLQLTPDTNQVVLTGKTTDGKAIIGTAKVQIVP